MGNLIEIQAQIEKLQKQATEIKSKEFDKTVKEIVAKMQAFGITLKDLQRGLGKAGRAASAARTVSAGARKRSGTPSRQKGKKVPPKYRGPKGETWSGRGMMPRWLATLVAQGKSRESFAIKD